MLALQEHERELALARAYQNQLLRLRSLDEARRAKLLHEKRIGVVGREVEIPTNYKEYDLDIFQVNYRWQRGRILGKGTFGEVYLGVNLDTGDSMAVKEFKLTSQNALKRAETMCKIGREMELIEGLEHPNLVRYFGVEVHREILYIFMELCERGTLAHSLKNGPIESGIIIQTYMYQLLSAVEYLHSHSIAHRDIKGDNIFLDDLGNIKLGDFGACVRLMQESQTIAGELNDLPGTPPFMAPEMIRGHKESGHGRKADIWSVGCVLIEMATGQRPWAGYEAIQIMYQVGINNATPAIPENLSPKGKEFLKLCFITDPIKRPTAAKLLSHPFVN